MKKAFDLTCRLFGKNCNQSSVDLIAMLWTLAITILFHALVLYIVFTFNLDHIIQNYGKLLLIISLVVFSACYFYLRHCFNRYIK